METAVAESMNVVWIELLAEYDESVEMLEMLGVFVVATLDQADDQVVEKTKLLELSSVDGILELLLILPIALLEMPEVDH